MLRIALVMTLVILAASSVLLAQDAQPAIPEMELVDIASYTIVESGGVVVVSLYDSDEELVGTADVTISQSGNVISEWFGEDGKHVIIESVGSGSSYTITDVLTDTTGDITYDEVNNQWTISNEVTQILADSSVATKLGASALAVGGPQTTAWVETSPAPELDGTGVSCDGPHCRGWGSSAAESHCCANAHSQASGCCTNSACWGCCRTFGCDSWCALGPYFCSCGFTGVACNPGDAGTGLLFADPLL